MGIQTYLLFRNCGGCVFKKSCVRILKSRFQKAQRGLRAKQQCISLDLSIFSVCVLMCEFVNPHWCLILRWNTQISSQDHLYRQFGIISYHWYYNIRSEKKQLCSVVPPNKSAQAISSIFSPKTRLRPNWQQSTTKMALARLRSSTEIL